MSIHAISNYQREVEKLIRFGGSRKETSIRTAFQNLLNTYCQTKGFILVPEIPIKTQKGKTVIPDGTVKDALRQDWGYWESKDEADTLDEEISKKFSKGYPNDNILFEDSVTAVLVQGGEERMRVAMLDDEKLHKLLTHFVSYERPEIKDFRTAIEHFKQDIPRVVEELRKLIEEQTNTNPKFIQARDDFHALCKESINPEISAADVREMMIQHILTEDIFNTIFDETQFHRENNIARELERVISTFFSGATKKNTLNLIKHYYDTINAKAASIADHHEKQKFLKVVYENFYKAYNPKGADRLGIVYTPNEIVNFMIESTDYLLHRHFNRGLSDEGVEILDPATGTGTFITDIIEFIQPHKLQHKYRHEIHANEVAILPYYIANLNIEFTYKQKMGVYEEFKNICFVDTLDNLGFDFANKQLDMFGLNAENAERIKRQNERKISVIIGNPPYNAKQENYNLNNANKIYKRVDKRIKETYIKHGTAQNQIVVYDMYTRFYRWASDRLNEDGILAFITNNSFINSRTFDGFRKSVSEEFSDIYVVDLGGDVRSNPKLSGTKNNVFGIQTGVAICFLIRKKIADPKHFCNIQYMRRPEMETAREKLDFLSESKIQDLPFDHIRPDNKNNWIELADNDFDSLLPMIDSDAKSGKSEKAVFKLYSAGVKSQRDEWVYDFDKKNLIKKMKFFVNVYQNELKNKVKSAISYEIKWDRELTKYLERKIEKKFQEEEIVEAIYRPFVKSFFYFDKHFNGMIYQWPSLYKQSEKNAFIAFSAPGTSKDFHCLATDTIADLHFTGDSQCLPLYRYDASGNRTENITDWALVQFRAHYSESGLNGLKDSTDYDGAKAEEKSISEHKNSNKDEKKSASSQNPLNPRSEITKEDIFHYTYAVLHNPAYREKYALNLKREFPRLPFYDDFHKWANYGKQLMDLHIGYEQKMLYPLEIVIRNVTVEPPHKLPSRLTADKSAGKISLSAGYTSVEINNIPPEAWEYKLGNRSALEWILDQYKPKKPKDETIREKYNTYNFEDHIIEVTKLIQRVCTVSVETMKIVGEMTSPPSGHLS